MSKSYRLFYALTESHIPQSWQEMDSLHFVMRDMFPDAEGKPFYEDDAPPTTGLVITDTLEFRLSSVIKRNNFHVIAFIQDIATQEVMIAVNGGPPPDTKVESDGISQLPVSFNIQQNFPNPFNPDTWIQFELSNPAEVELSVYNLQGQIVRKLVSAAYSSGSHKIHWDGTNDSGLEAASGLYYLKAKFQNEVQFIKMIKMK